MTQVLTALSKLVEGSSSIAIVGNSPVLLHTKNGKLIDDVGSIIRINDGRNIGFEQHAGSRTDVRFVGVPIKRRYEDFFSSLSEASTILTRIENRRRLSRLGWTGQAVFLDDYQSIPSRAIERLAAIVPVAEIPAKNPRTGIVILSLLVSEMLAGCKVHLFGFETEIRAQGTEHFYDDGRDFTEAKKNWDSYHCPMEFEFELLRNLESASFISIH